MSHAPDETPDDDSETAESADGFAAFVELLEPSAPPAGGRERLLAALRSEGRLSAYAARVAELLDVDATTAARMLDAAGTPAAYEPGPFPGVTLSHVEGGEAVRGAITGFVRIEGGASFPTHEHLGEETVLVVQGSMLDPETGRVFRAGDVVRAARGTAHATVARPGPDLVYLAVLFDGLRVGDTEMRADDPRL